MKKRRSQYENERLVVEDIQSRRNALRKIILEYEKQDKEITRNALLKELDKKGFHIDMATLYRDRTSLNKENTFIEDIAAESNYSAYIEEMFEKIHRVEEKAGQLYEMKWTDDKIIKRETRDGQFKEEHHTSENPGPKIGLLNVILKCQEAKLKMFSGDNINISVTLLGRKLEEYKVELEKLRSQEKKG